MSGSQGAIDAQLLTVVPHWTPVRRTDGTRTDATRTDSTRQALPVATYPEVRRYAVHVARRRGRDLGLTVGLFATPACRPC